MDKKTKNIRTEINELKRKLNELNVQKEKWFSVKENMNKEVHRLIKIIRGVKYSKDKTNETIYKLKEQRDKYNKQTQDLIQEFKKLNENKKKILKERKIDFNPSKILENINNLEKTIETEALSFTKEQNLMKKIKEFKKQLKGSEGVQDLFKKLKNISDKITESKKKAEEHHAKVQEEYNKNKRGYEEFMALTKQINKLNKNQEEAFSKFLRSKSEFSKINSEIKDKLEIAGKLNYSKQIHKRKIQAKELEKKAEEVENKIRERKKLTNEDILVFQKDVK